ncbi:MAG TPA: citryl-CoA lyase [Candidatus Saccharimonadales bacterium]|nr:citryl-CoA lyase [Candidatus Saccharimonadales bacterium]
MTRRGDSAAPYPGSTMADLHWKTAITKVEPNRISLRGYAMDQLMGRITFAQGFYLALKGELPDERTGRMIDAILVSSIDHGATPPSALTARMVTATGAPLSSAIAAGVLAISRLHGGAIEEGMIQMREVARRADADGSTEEAAAARFVMEAKEQGRRLSGFGHRIHTDDPRTKKLLELAGELELAGRHVRIARHLEDKLAASSGRKLPLNVDGAIAAVLCDMGFDPAVGNAFFILSRVAGMVAHIQEERTRERPMRRIHPSDHEYDGPPDRDVG